MVLTCFCGKSLLKNIFANEKNVQLFREKLNEMQQNLLQESVPYIWLVC